MTSKKPIIGTIFSSDSSDESSKLPPRVRSRISQTSASESDNKKKIRLRVSVSSGGEQSSTTPAESIDSYAPEGYIILDKTRIGTLSPNSLVQYEKTNGKIVKPKYFKQCDSIAATILLGFYSHNKRNYSEQLSNIKTIFVQSGAKGGGADALKETIELKPDQWKNIRRDMIISYEKADHEFIYKSKFNAFLKGPDGSTKMSLTSERGFSYTANPTKILKIFRHLTGNDKTLSYILESMRKLEIRVRQLEANKKK